MFCTGECQALVQPPQIFGYERVTDLVFLSKDHVCLVKRPHRIIVVININLNSDNIFSCIL